MLLKSIWRRVFQENWGSSGQVEGGEASGLGMLLSSIPPLPPSVTGPYQLPVGGLTRDSGSYNSRAGN